MIVLDTSAAVEWLLRTSTGLKIEKRIYSRVETLHSPHILDLEFAQVMRRLVREGTISERRADEGIHDLLDLRVARYPHFTFLPRIWQHRHNLSAYDGAYVALAEGLGAPLVTCDRRLAAASAHQARVEVF